MTSHPTTPWHQDPVPRTFRVLQLLLAQVLLTLPLAVAAEVHSVTVNDGNFSPNDLTIAAGDTVRWNRTDSQVCDPYYGCTGGGEHSVTADDGSFSSGAPASSFTFDHTFTVPGVYLYHCSEHSQAGRDINTNMNGRITVQGVASAFEINTGLNDSWFDPATPGQGFFITVFPDIGMMFLAWFTYDTVRPAPSANATLGESGHRWLTAFGPYSGDLAMLEVELTEGGVFDSDQPAVMQRPDGTIEVLFSDCNSGLVSYDIPSAGVTGEVPIERIALDNVPMCEALANP